MALLFLAALQSLGFPAGAGGDRTQRPYPASALSLAMTSIVIWVAVIAAGRLVGFI